MRSVSIQARRVAAAGVILAVVLALGGWRWHAPHRHAAPIGVVIITLDTTRADRLSVYGYMKVSLPNLERLAREGVVFDQATAAVPLTLPSHTSLFTGLFPPAHGVRDNAAPPLATTPATLAEILQRRGFRTGAFVGSVVLDASRGLARGFERYRGVSEDAGARNPLARQRRADAVISEALEWLDGVRESPFFLWAHLYDPHRPYDPPEPYLSANDDPYIGEIAFADAQIGRLLDDLARRRLLDRTIVIVAGDHGESLGDHGETDHGIFLYESVLHVPLIVRAPHVPPSRVNDVVRLVDVMPTVLELIGAPRPATDGVSLLDRMIGKTAHLDLEAYSESMYPQRFGWSPLRSLRSGRHKFVEAPRRELYDLEQDPFELRNLYPQRRELARLMEERLLALEGTVTAESGLETSVAPEVRERLASLGYVSSSARPAARPGDLLDPKDCLTADQAQSGSRRPPGCRTREIFDSSTFSRETTRSP